MSVAMKDLPRRHGITVDEYYRMAETGEIAPDARVELIEGEIIDRPPIGSPHGAMETRPNELLLQTFGRQAIVRWGLALRLDNMSEPQPDFLLVSRRPQLGNSATRVDLKRSRLHRFRQPSGDEYLDSTVLEAPGVMSVEKFPGSTLDTSSLF